MGYISDISFLSKFRKSFLLPVWNGLFTILLKSLSDRVSGSDNASKLFYTLIYGLYTRTNVDFHTVIWNQFAYSFNSTTRHMEISCARFWSIVVKRALLHYKVPEMTDSLMAEIPMMQTTTFVTTDPRNFDFVGSILEAIMEKVHLNNAIIRTYHKLPASGVQDIHTDLKKIIEVGDLPKRGGKKKAKAIVTVSTTVSKKLKKMVNKP